MEKKMLVLLPLLSFGLLIEIFRRKGFDWRRQILFATIPWALFLVLATESLSVFHFLTREGVSLAWVAFLLATLGCLFRVTSRPVAQNGGTELLATGVPLERSDRLAIYFMAPIAALIGLTAFFAAPNTWDSMEYHMPRVVEWMVNRGVQFYPTIDHQQLTMPPMAEYTILHFDLLYGGDRLANFVQWFSYIGCILGVTLIVEELGGDRRAQVFSGVLAATLPTAILGASGTKNDQVLAYWITTSVYLLLRWKVRQDWLHTLALGSTLSLAAFTKGTSYTFLPLLVVACIPIWGLAATRRFVVRLPIFALLLLIVCGPLFIRSYKFSGSIFGPRYFPGAGSEQARLIRNPHITPAIVAASVVRNISLDVGVPNAHINAFSTRVFSSLIRAVGVKPSDPSQIVVAKSGRLYPFAVVVDSLLETESSNPVQTLLVFLAGAAYLINFKKMKHATGWLGVGIIGAFVLYSAVVRWSPWNARYQLPLFVLASAFVALVLPRVLPRMVIAGISYLVLLFAVPFALRNSTRPLLTREGKNSILIMPRDETYFLDQHRSYADSFIAAASAVKAEGCHSIGLDSNLLHLDYPMLALLSADKAQRRLSYVSVNNGTERYKSEAEPAPCIVVCLKCADAEEKRREYSDSEPAPSVYGGVVVFHYPNGFVERPRRANGEGISAAK
jgi:4-amino-4-deoxy-L-arabinose transferase-like glycosyltransferase